MNSTHTETLDFSVDTKPLADVKPLARVSLAEQIADELRKLVLLEKLAPGAAIPERETAAALGVSRTPLRESLRILATEGLIDIEPNRPPRVANPSIEKLGDLLEVLGTLESLAGELACSHATDIAIEHICELENTMQNESENLEPLRFFELDMQFHQSIVKASNNEALINTHQTYNSQLWRARFMSSRERVNRPGTLRQHCAIIKALTKRDGATCSQALKQHINSGLANVSRAMSLVDHKGSEE